MKNRIKIGVLASVLLPALMFAETCRENYPSQCFARTISCYLGSCVASGTTYNGVRLKTGTTANTGDTLVGGQSICHYSCVVYWGLLNCTAEEDVVVGVQIATGTWC